MIRAALGQAGGERGALVLILVDLDGFGEVNDTVGDVAGDEILASVAARLERSIREDGVVARVGDDEFALLVATRGREASARTICERILAEMDRPFGACGLRLSASMGAVSRAPDAASMLHRARLALAEAKAGGGCRYRLFAPELERRRAARLDLQAEVARALEREELEVRYQAIHALPAGVPSGAEALLRWESGPFGAVRPDKVVAAAHAAGLGARLEHWVLRSACRDAAAWPAIAGRRLRVSVNVSPSLFTERALPERVAAVLAETGLEAARLDLELTEESLLRECPETTRNIRRLAAMGVGLVLDDFGTRYANFGYLANLPVTRLKIDRSFVAAPTRCGTRPLLRALIDMSRELGIPAVAEGIEDAPQLEFVARHGCAEAQGFHLGAVLPAAGMRARLSSWAAAS